MSGFGDAEPQPEGPGCPIRLHPAPRLRASAPCCSQWPIQLDDDKFVVVRLSRTYVAADAKGKVVIVEDTNMARVEKEHVFDGLERKREAKTQPHISGDPQPIIGRILHL